MSTENQPHVVYPNGAFLPATVMLCATYAEAHAQWTKCHTREMPLLIMSVTLGRVIDPSTPIIDVNE
jgi:hypothetical protein